MANIRTGSIVSDIRGKVGSEIYSRNRGGAYVKAYAAPVQPGTAAQMTNESNFATAVNTWLSLTDDQRHNWNSFAADQKTKGIFTSNVNLTGRSLFISRKMNILSIGLNDNPAPHQSLPRVKASYSVIYSNAVNNFQFTPSIVGNYNFNRAAVYASPIVSSGVMSPNSTRFSRVGVSTPITSPFSILRIDYEDIFGSMAGAAGRKVFFKFRVINLAINKPGSAQVIRTGQQVSDEVYAVCVLPAIT